MWSRFPGIVSEDDSEEEEQWADFPDMSIDENNLSVLNRTRNPVCFLLTVVCKSKEAIPFFTAG